MTKTLVTTQHRRSELKALEFVWDLSFGIWTFSEAYMISGREPPANKRHGGTRGALFAEEGWWERTQEALGQSFPATVTWRGTVGHKRFVVVASRP